MTHEKPTERSVPAQKRSRERRERILEAAAQVFAEKGLGFATMEAIAHE
ncbi:MAG: TetR family transcriptional regulator, partial [Myxococcales bacterium]|nr:TetR family transcriptional regulator [Myxococcales bacterium]